MLSEYLYWNSVAGVKLYPMSWAEMQKVAFSLLLNTQDSSSVFGVQEITEMNDQIGLLLIHIMLCEPSRPTVAWSVMSLPSGSCPKQVSLLPNVHSQSVIHPLTAYWIELPQLYWLNEQTETIRIDLRSMKVSFSFIFLLPMVQTIPIAQEELYISTI